MELPGEPPRPLSRVDPADLELPSTTPLEIDIVEFLNALARATTNPDMNEFERSVPLGEDPDFEPMLGLISRSIESAMGFIELPHLRVLVLLSQKDAMSIDQLATLTSTRSQRLFALLDSMESSGWISPVSRARGVGETIEITQQGRNVVNAMTERRQRDIDEILARMSDPDRVALTRAFNSFAAAAQEEPVRQPKRGIAT